MAFKTDLAAKLIEFLQDKLSDEDFQGALSLIEEQFEIDDSDSLKGTMAMDRAIDRARRAPKRQVALDGTSGLGNGLLRGKRIDTSKAEAELAAMAGGEAA